MGSETGPVQESECNSNPSRAATAPVIESTRVPKWGRILWQARSICQLWIDIGAISVRADMNISNRVIF